MDLSHLGYVHLKTIGGDAAAHMNAEMHVESDDETVSVRRYLLGCTPPPTYTKVYPFPGKIDRWQEVGFHVSYITIWTGGIDVGSDKVENPNRGGFHMRGFHAITPETDRTCHYFWTQASNPPNDKEATIKKISDQVRYTFDEDKVVIEAQYANFLKSEAKPLIDIHVDSGATRARRIIERMTAESTAVN